MKKLSIRLRVTLWFTLLMTLLVIFVLSILLFTGAREAHRSSESKLIFAVESLTSDHDEDDKEDGHANGKGYIREGVYLSVYDLDGNYLAGTIPTGFDANVSFSSGQTSTAETDAGDWTIYDFKTELEEFGQVWIRGIVPSGNTRDTVAVMQQLSFIILPFFVVLAALSGYLLTGRAFRPVTHITRLAEEIGDGRDLSKRLNLGQGMDEIYTLANTFDRMFDRLEQSFEREKQFAADASHELRTPVSVILSQCEYALESREMPEETRSILTVIQKQAQKMSELISQLLALTRADKGQLKLNLEPVNLSELGELVAEELRGAAAEKSINIQTNIAPDLRMNGDETLLMRMLINLISNAVAYGRTNGMVWFELDREGQNIVGHVRDNGIGLAREHLDKIWDRFYQVDPSRSSAAEGAGLGLSMVKWIAEAHGGRVSVRSEPGKGSDFIITLPTS